MLVIVCAVDCRVSLTLNLSHHTTPQVTIPRDRLFWNRILPLLESFHLGHVVPAKQRLAQEDTEQQLQLLQPSSPNTTHISSQHAPVENLTDRSSGGSASQPRRPVGSLSSVQPVLRSREDVNNPAAPTQAPPPTFPQPKPTLPAPWAAPQRSRNSMQLLQQYAAQQLSAKASPHQQPQALPSVRLFTSQQRSAITPVSASPWKVIPQTPHSPNPHSPALPPLLPPNNPSPGRLHGPLSTPAVSSHPPHVTSPMALKSAPGMGALPTAPRTARVGPLTHAPWVRQGVDRRK